MCFKVGENKTNGKNDEQSYPSKKIIINLIILFAVAVLTATLTYSLTSNQYLDQQESQNDQIRALQNALRKANGLTEIEEL